jgi:hypothetical protein
MTSAPLRRDERRTDIPVAIGKEHIMTDGALWLSAQSAKA